MITEISKSIHWQTQKLVDVLANLQPYEETTYAQLAVLCDIDIGSIKKRLLSAKNITLRDHNVIIETVRMVGVVKVEQKDVTAPVKRQKNKIRSAAKKGRKFIKHGVTDWDALSHEKRTQLWTDSAQLGTIELITDRS